MPKIITFSQKFPDYHPNAGQPTYFVEKFWNSIQRQNFIINYYSLHDYNPKNKTAIREFWNKTQMDYNKLGLKNHTIRNGHRFKKGEYFQPAVWGTDVNPKSSRKGPYHSKMIFIAPPTLITDAFNIKIEGYTMKNVNAGDKYLFIRIGNHIACEINQIPKTDIPEKLAHNDGLDLKDFINWFTLSKQFKKTGVFEGQIICWNPNIKY